MLSWVGSPQVHDVPHLVNEDEGQYQRREGISNLER